MSEDIFTTPQGMRLTTIADQIVATEDTIKKLHYTVAHGDDTKVNMPEARKDLQAQRDHLCQLRLEAAQIGPYIVTAFIDQCNQQEDIWHERIGAFNEIKDFLDTSDIY